ncbi:MAG: undecaprenyl/decaprenyl-phosphate alpha-N-acetylglucosaminyl 1-phosphate transferase [Candidatus Saganbacteria bacterium]|nr:undecaprenyl/decaprenyl-phosphate alpha-N-acetylglucosaminyl 1-phosphate transferase [Candidatus Saganbacteria bacterium]
MLKFVLIFLSSLVLSLILTPVAKFLSHKFHILDQPGHRKIHSKPIPLLGGIAIYLSFVGVLWLTGLEARVLWSIAGFGLFFILFGLLDDAGIKIRARYKIWSHLLASFLFIYASGIVFQFFRFDPINWVLTACFITFMTNSMNMLDGMDGLVTGVGFFGSTSLCVLALNNSQPGLALAALALAGACLGFLRYNFNPASIFLGEGGSTFIGFAMALISLRLELYKLWDIALVLNIPRLQFISFVVPLIILGIPIFDTFYVFTNRYLHHIKFSTPGKDHSHHRIHLMGLSQKATVLALYCVQIVLGAISLAMINADLQQFFSLLLIVAIFALVAWAFLNKVEVYSPEANG